MAALRTRVCRFLLGRDASERLGSGTYDGEPIPPALRLPMVPAKHGRNPDVSRIKVRPPPPEPIATLQMLAAGVRNGRESAKQPPENENGASS